MKLINARVTFRKSPICMLEKFTFKDINHAYIYFKKYSKLTEFMILQTCNRVEIFAVVNNYKINNIRKTWSNLIGITERSFTKRLEINKDNNDAYNHILKLTSGLDSMVIGEEQILHQIKEAIIIAKKMECYGNYLNNLFEKALKIGIKIRKNTGINQNNRISIGLVATRMIEKSVPDLSHKKILLIGTGMASTTIAKSLRNKGYEFQVASRSITRAKWFSNNISKK